MSKTISFDKIPLGETGVYDAPYFYHPGHRCLETDLTRFWDWKIHNFLFGPLPRIQKEWHTNHISETKWRSSDTLVRWTPSGYLGFIYEFFAIDTEEKATKDVLDTVDDVINKCPSDNVLIFGHELRLKNSVIVPEIIPYPDCKRPRETYNRVYASILCGFLGQ